MIMHSESWIQMYARVMKEKNKVDFNNEYKIRLGISKNK